MLHSHNANNSSIIVEREGERGGTDGSRHVPQLGRYDFRIYSTVAHGVAKSGLSHFFKIEFARFRQTSPDNDPLRAEHVDKAGDTMTEVVAMLV